MATAVGVSGIGAVFPFVRDERGTPVGIGDPEPPRR